MIQQYVYIYINISDSFWYPLDKTIWTCKTNLGTGQQTKSFCFPNHLITLPDCQICLMENKQPNHVFSRTSTVSCIVFVFRFDQSIS